RDDERFKALSAHSEIRFYAGAPVMSRGQCVGSLCVLDVEPRVAFGPQDMEHLLHLARLAEHMLDTQALRAQLTATQAERVQAEARARLAIDGAANAFAACDRIAVSLEGRCRQLLMQLQCQVHNAALANGLGLLTDIADELALVARLEGPNTYLA